MAQYKIAEFSLIYEDFENSNFRGEFIVGLRNRLYSEIEKINWNPEVSIVIDVIDGSIKGQIKVYTNITLVVGLLAAYGGTRDGIEHLVNDSKYLFNKIEEGINGREYFSERYLKGEINNGIIEEIKNTIEEIDSLERNYDVISPFEQKNKLKKLKQKLSNILESMEIEDRKIVQEEIKPSIRENLPKPERDESQIWRNKFAILEEDELKIYRGSKI